LPLWTQNGALEIELLESKSDELAFNVTRCRYSEMYKDIGLDAIGDILSCNRDAEFCVGYNSDIEFQRTRTIMQGDSHCDFRYRMRKRDATK
jgi:hypothetical protein